MQRNPLSWMLARLSLALCFCGMIAPISVAQLEPTASSNVVLSDEIHSLDAALERASENRSEIQKALEEVPSDQRAGMEFLITYMPTSDLRELKSEFLLENVALAYKTFAATPWKDAVPEEIFFNDILPYASVDETRDDWRAEFYEKFQPLVADATTPGEAAAILNQEIFGMLDVRYSTQRNRANQGPYETIETGMASCSGLSILLIDACRSVGVPARFVGTPLWTDKSGNHSWVEVYDEGWHFTGAAEPTGDELNKAWFVGRASAAQRDSAMSAIYAVSYKATPIYFPLVWDRFANHISAVNVTDRYTNRAEPLPEGMARVRFRVYGPNDRERLVAKIVIRDSDDQVMFNGETNDERFDANDHLTARLAIGETYNVQAIANDKQRTMSLGNFEDETLITIHVSKGEWIPNPTDQKSSNDESASASNDPMAEVSEQLNEYFALSPDERAEFRFDPKWNETLVSNADEIRDLAWKAYKSGHEAKARIADLEADKVSWGDYTSPYVLKNVGEKPDSGWPLFIAMHGGGGVPPEVNDQQWRHMQIYYKDQASVEGYRYLALRAPTNTWNGFYTTYNLPLTDNLIKQFLIGGDVDPNRVFIMGYSHGGYGTWFIARHMADRFAAAHASASAPTIGNEIGRNLRNTRFTYMFGEKDTRYGRLDRCRSFSEYMDELKAKPENESDYPVTAEYKEGFGHGGLPDRDKISEMYEHVRDPVPSHVTWLPTNNEVRYFNWLHIDQVTGGQQIDAKINDNQLAVATTNVDNLSVFVDERLVDLNQELKINFNGAESTAVLKPSLRTLCESLADRGDPEFAFTVRVELSQEPKQIDNQ